MLDGSKPYIRAWVSFQSTTPQTDFVYIYHDTIPKTYLPEELNYGQNRWH
jgi:hypothetical protein